MDNMEKENKLSSYIDSLNNEKRPMEHGNIRGEDDLEELLETVRKVKSLKNQSLPDNKFSDRLNEKLKKEILKEKTSRKTKKRWFYGAASVAAAAMLIFTINLTGPLRQTNMVYAMEEAYNGVKAYHGILEVVETNAEGKTNVQSKLEVWADKDGRYKLPNDEQALSKPQVEVKYDLKIEEADQKSVDAGHSPWKLDPIFVSQVFVSLKISPEGITGDYPIKYEELKMVKNNGKEAVVEVNSAKSPIIRVYLKRLIRQENTGIWTVVGYDPAK